MQLWGRPSIKGRQPTQKTPTQIKIVFAQQFGQTLSACFPLVLEEKGGTVCTNCPEIVCANCVFIWVGVFLGGWSLHQRIHNRNGTVGSRLSFPATEPPDARRVSEGFQKGAQKGSLKGSRRVSEGFEKGPELTPSKTLRKPFIDPFRDPF